MDEMAGSLVSGDNKDTGADDSESEHNDEYEGNAVYIKGDIVLKVCRSHAEEELVSRRVSFIVLAASRGKHRGDASGMMHGTLR